MYYHKLHQTTQNPKKKLAKSTFYQKKRQNNYLLRL